MRYWTVLVNEAVSRALLVAVVGWSVHLKAVGHFIDRVGEGGGDAALGYKTRDEHTLPKGGKHHRLSPPLTLKACMLLQLDDICPLVSRISLIRGMDQAKYHLNRVCCLALASADMFERTLTATNLPRGLSSRRAECISW